MIKKSAFSRIFLFLSPKTPSPTIKILSRKFSCTFLINTSLYPKRSGPYKEIFTRDEEKDGGTGFHNKTVRSKKGEMHGFEQSIHITLPPLSTLYFSVPAPKKAAAPKKTAAPKAKAAAAKTKTAAAKTKASAAKKEPAAKAAPKKRAMKKAAGDATEK